MNEVELAVDQATLRDMVLRLIQIDSSGRPAILGLKPREGDWPKIGDYGLSVSSAALDFLERYHAEAALLDEIAGLYLDRIERQSYSIDDSKLPFVSAVVCLGASEPMLERTMAAVVRESVYTHCAEALAEKLGRPLGVSEVETFVRHHYRTHRAGYRDGDIEAFAERHLGESGKAYAKHQAEMRFQRIYPDAQRN